MNKIIFVTFFLFLCLTGFSQTDTIFSHNEKISCKVVKIKTDSINYRLIGTDVLHSIAKKEVDKIIYKNGKVFSIKEDISIQHVDGIANFNDVVITLTPSDTIKCTYISSIEAECQHDQSGQSKYREKTFQRLKMLAALRGANIVFITEQNLLPDSGDTTESFILSAVAYCSDAPTIDAFDKIIGDKNEFNATEQWYLPKERPDVYQLYFNGKFMIEEISEVDGFVHITGELKGFPKITSFRLIAVSQKFFTINFEWNNSLYNVRVEL